MKREIRTLQENGQISRHQRAVRERFRENLRQSITIALRNNLDVFLAIPPINLLVPPSEQHWSRELDPNKEHRLQELMRQSSVNWAAVLEIDPSFALAAYSLGMQRHQEGRIEEARTYLRQAVSHDHFSQRITPELQQELLTLCDSFPSIHCIRVDQAFDTAAQDGIPDASLFVDFCHPTAERGTSLIVNSFASEIKRLRR